MHLRRALAIGALLACAPASLAAQEARPNFVFFLVDDLGWVDLSCTGSSFYETPNIDRLRQRSMWFTDGYAAAPVCSPTRSSILTGKYPARNDNTEWFGGRRGGKMRSAEYVDRMVLEEVTFAEVLQEAGWRTGFFGKWHLGAEGFEPEAQGFDKNVAGCRWGNPGNFFWPYQRGNRQVPHVREGGAEGEYLTDRLGDEAVRWLDGVAADPFLLYFSFYAVHTPLQAPEDLVEKYRVKKDALALAGREIWGQEGERKLRLVQEHAIYAGMVEALDRNVGKVLDALDARGLAEETVIFFMSDNGGLSTSEGHPTSNLPLRAGKGWLYEGGIREPYFVSWPGVTPENASCRVPVTSTDFYPTILEIAGLDPMPEQHVDGVSLVPLLRGGDALDREALYWHYPHYSNQGGRPGSAVREGKWKLIERHEDGRLELYDLEADLGEHNEISEAHPEVVARLRDRLVAFRAATDAKMPRPKED